MWILSEASGTQCRPKYCPSHFPTACSWWSCVSPEAAPADSVCDNGQTGVQDPNTDVCCPLECGDSCGGDGCGTIPGVDASQCCAAAIVASGIECDGTTTPCVQTSGESAAHFFSKSRYPAFSGRNAPKVAQFFPNWLPSSDLSRVVLCRGDCLDLPQRNPRCRRRKYLLC